MRIESFFEMQEMTLLVFKYTQTEGIHSKEWYKTMYETDTPVGLVTKTNKPFIFCTGMSYLYLFLHACFQTRPPEKKKKKTRFRK